MIVYDLQCLAGGHRFEGWFGSSDDYTRQQDAGLVTCPQCGSAEVTKAVMAPSVGRKSNQISETVKPQSAKTGSKTGSKTGREIAEQASSNQPLPPEAVKMIRALAKMQAKALENSRWVGDSFAEDARAMHYGEREAEAIHGETTQAEAESLLEEGISVAPLPFPVIPPKRAN